MSVYITWHAGRANFRLLSSWTEEAQSKRTRIEVVSCAPDILHQIYNPAMEPPLDLSAHGLVRVGQTLIRIPSKKARPHPSIRLKRVSPLVRDRA